MLDNYPLTARRIQAAKSWFHLLLLSFALVAVAPPAEGKDEKVEIKIVLQDGANAEELLKGLSNGKEPMKSPETFEVWFFDTPGLNWFSQEEKQLILRARIQQDPAQTEMTIKVRSTSGLLPDALREWESKPTPGGEKTKLELDQVYLEPSPKDAKESLSISLKKSDAAARAVIQAAQKPDAASAQKIRELFTPFQQAALDAAAAGGKFSWEGMRAFGSATVTKWEFDADTLPLLATINLKEITVERWAFAGLQLTEVSTKVPKGKAQAAGAALMGLVKAQKWPVAIGGEAEAKTKRFLDHFVNATTP